MKKNKEIKVRVSSEEFERIKNKAEFLGVPISTFIRLVALAVKNPQIATE